MMCMMFMGENNKILLKGKRKESFTTFMGTRFPYFKDVSFPKLTLKFNAISIKIPVGFSGNLYDDSKMHMKSKSQD